MIARHVSDILLAALRDTPVVFINGARQTGKSTLAQALVQGPHPASYVTLDDATALSAASSDATGFVGGLPEPVVIDEVQRAPDVFLAIKAEVDRRRTPGRFLLTASANVWLLPTLADSLAGRMEVVTLWPLSQGEIVGKREDFVDRLFAGGPPGPGRLPQPEEDLARLVLAGGYPESVERKDPARRSAWFGAYLTTLLQRDVREMAHIEGLTELPRLLALLAARAGSLLNASELSRASGIPTTTLRRYLSLLEAAFLFVPLPAWSANLSKRLIKMPKIFLNDTGLAGYLQGLEAGRLRSDRRLLGPLLENWVSMELRKQTGWSRCRVSLFHFRTVSGQEVDLVLEDPSGAVAAVEVKASAQVTADDFRGLKALKELSGDRFRCGVVLYAGRETVPFGADLWAAPIGSLWA